MIDRPAAMALLAFNRLALEGIQRAFREHALHALHALQVVSVVWDPARAGFAE